MITNNSNFKLKNYAYYKQPKKNPLVKIINGFRITEKALLNAESLIKFRELDSSNGILNNYYVYYFEIEKIREIEEGDEE